jgi:hypothetical protein
MCIALQIKAPRTGRVGRSVDASQGNFQLKGRLLKAVRSELRAAKESGLTWRVIWGTLREEGYPGGISSSGGAANRVIEGTQPQIARKPKNLQPPVVEKEVHQPMVRESGLNS